MTKTNAETASKTGPTKESPLEVQILRETFQNIDKIRSEHKKQQVQLELFSQTPEHQYVGPNVVIRSALFGLVAKGSRKYIQNEDICSWGDSKIQYEGEQLDQSDFDAWMLLIKWCGRKVFKERDYVRLEFPLHRFLKELGKSTGGKDRIWATQCLERLTGRVKVKDGYQYKGGLIHESFIDAETRKAVVLINPKLAQVFYSGFTRLDMDTRLRLKGDLAKWLHAFLKSHRGPVFTISIKKLMALVGSRTEKRYFKRNLKQALETLREAAVIQSWKIDERDNAIVSWEAKGQTKPPSDKTP